MGFSEAVDAKGQDEKREASPISTPRQDAADRRSTAVPIFVSFSTPASDMDFVKLGDLSDNVRIKRGGPFMHLKAYAIDGEALRTGSANFSTSGERQQDNDLIVICDPGDAYAIGELPNNDSAAAASLAVSQSGLATTRVVVLLTPEEMDKAGKKSVNYLGDDCGVEAVERDAVVIALIDMEDQWHVAFALGRPRGERRGL